MADVSTDWRVIVSWEVGIQFDLEAKKSPMSCNMGNEEVGNTDVYPIEYLDISIYIFICKCKNFEPLNSFHDSSAATQDQG